jgi:hypothetical protein
MLPKHFLKVPGPACRGLVCSPAGSGSGAQKAVAFSAAKTSTHSGCSIWRPRVRPKNSLISSSIFFAHAPSQGNVVWVGVVFCSAAELRS